MAINDSDERFTASRLMSQVSPATILIRSGYGTESRNWNIMFGRLGLGLGFGLGLGLGLVLLELKMLIQYDLPTKKTPNNIYECSA